MSKKFLSPKIRNLTWKEVFHLFKHTCIEFASEKSLFHGAALSYYTIFALVPILYLSIVSFGQFLGQDKMLEIISNVLTDQVGIKDVKGIIDFLHEINFHKKNVVLQGVGIFVLLISSTAILSSLKHSINEFYDVELVHETNKKLILATVIDKLVHVVLLMVFGLIIILAYFVQIILLSFGDHLFHSLHEFHSIFEFLTMHILPLFTNIVIFYFIFKYISDALVPVKYALAGSLVTSILLYLGQLLIKYYITHYFFAKDTGIAGTLLILLTWVYYTSQLIFFGAKFIAVYAKIIGKPLVVKKI